MPLAPAASSDPLWPIPMDWPGRAHSRLVGIDGITWHVQQRGDGPDLLLIHGTGGSTHSWAAVADALAGSFRVVAIDLPGHGFTAVPSAVEQARNVFALPGMARAVGDLLDTLGVRPTCVAGHSAGVPVLLQLVADGRIAPERVVGICPALVPPPAWYLAWVAPLLAMVVEQGVVADAGAAVAAATRLVETMLGRTGSRLPPESLARYRTLCSRPAHIHAALTMMARWDLPALYRQLATAPLSMPVTLVAGREDRWIPVHALRQAVGRYLPAAELREMAGGHLLPEENAEGVRRELLRHP